MKKKQRALTEKERKVAVDILEEVILANVQMPRGWYDKIMERYQLMIDPFTQLPCTPDEWAKNTEEYDRQLMEQRFGYYE